jgi:hypothetical protein
MLFLMLSEAFLFSPFHLIKIGDQGKNYAWTEAVLF